MVFKVLFVGFQIVCTFWSNYIHLHLSYFAMYFSCYSQTSGNNDHIRYMRPLFNSHNFCYITNSNKHTSFFVSNCHFMKGLLTFITAACLLFACKKSEKAQEGLTQYAVYTVGFEETNLDKGIAVITLLLSPDKNITIEGFSFQYSEKDFNKIKSVACDFSQHAIHQDATLKKHSTFGDYMNDVLKSPSSFKKASKLSNEQISKLVNSLSFDLAYSKSPPKDDLFLTFMKAVIPTANAQGGRIEGTRATYVTLISILAGVYVGTGVTALGLTGMAAIGVGVLAGTVTQVLVSSATGTPVTVTFDGIGSSLTGDFGAILFGSSQLANSWNSDYINPVLQALGGSPNGQLPETLGDLWPNIKNFINVKIGNEKITCKLIASTGNASSITATSAIASGEANFNCSGTANILRGICISTTQEGLSYYDPKVPATNGVGSFTSAISNLNPATVYYYRAYSIYFYANNVIAEALGDIKTFKTGETLTVGDNAYGGIIFYVDASGKHGMVCTNVDIGNAQWSIDQNSNMGVYASAIGTGQANTNAIIAFQGNTGSYAAKICNDLVRNGYSDWYLPSKDEVDLIIKKVVNPSNTNPSYHIWSSTESTLADISGVYRLWAWSQSNHTNAVPSIKNSYYGIRAVRTF